MIAKLTRPQLGNPIRREKLFGAMDAARLRGASLFITAPPGAGKTTLVASWLQSRNIRGIWYQADRADRDPATFFYYLGQAASGLSRRGGMDLPVLTPGHLHDVEAFARRFFRDFFSRMDCGSALVIDNCHDLTGEQKTRLLIAQAVEEAPSAVTVVAISREGLPEGCARWVANEKMVLLDWQQLKLTLEEAREIANLRNKTSAIDVEGLYLRSLGWAAGFTLLLEGVRSSRTGKSGELPDTPDILFEYFTAEVFQRANPATQRLLLLTAHLPWVDVEVAREISGNPQAGAALAELHRRNLFTDRLSRSRPGYQYHPLFRQFLLGKAKSALEPGLRRTLSIETARLLERRKEWEAAVPLFLEVGAWQEAGELIVAGARSLLSQGRWQTLVEWIGRIPGERLDACPWLRYWLGVSRAAIDAAAGRTELERAFNLFRDRRDRHGEMLCAAEILRAFFLEFRSFQRVDQWIDVLIALVAGSRTFPDEECELRILSALLSALVSRRPDHPSIHRYAERANELLDRITEPNLIVSAGIGLCFYTTLCARISLAEATAAAVHPHLGSADLSPVLHVFWLGSYGYLRYVAGDSAEAIRLFEEAEHTSESTGLAPRIAHIRAWHAYCVRRTGDVRGAEALASQLERSANDVGSLANTLWLRALNERSRGHIGHAVELGAKALGMEANDCILHGSQQLQLAEMMIEAQRLEDSERWLERGQQLIRGTFSEKAWSAVFLFIESLIALKRAELDLCRTRLAQALAEIRCSERLVFIRWFAYTLSELLPMALKFNIETETACRIINELRIAPKDRQQERWPWAIRIRMLGQFEITVLGQPICYSRKIPRKPLALLGLIIALGGRNVPEETLLDALWPESEGDVGYRLLKVTLHRLRTLLDVRDVIVQKGGLLSLDFTQCWVDTLAFQELASKTEPEALDAALALYKGPLSIPESDAPWAYQFGTRLKALFARTVLARASTLEAQNRPEIALLLYQRGLEANDTIEALHEGVVRCYRRLNQQHTGAEPNGRLMQPPSIRPGR
ncbi:MAG TPA: BTAD domain-containing putative transcriptional regulator [Burkholderiales bacterium]|nr:BTAD domain-containing putative transcriptional regulator [Burkholderiales bacterium]